MPMASMRRASRMRVVNPRLELLTSELHPPLSAAEALLEADRCLGCGGAHAEAPCAAACPADVDVPGFIGALAVRDELGAARTILAENLLGGTCARVCPVEVLCEGACVLHADGRKPIAIGALQRYATDAAFADDSAVLRRTAPQRPQRVAVVGAGPAGLACAGELAVLGYRVTVYEWHDEIGGLVRYAIAPYREQREPLPAEQRLLERLGVEFRLGTAAPPEALAAADAVFLGVGLGPDVPVHYPGDELAGVWDSLPFIEAMKTGSPPRVGGDVVVVGGGNTAVDVAREAVRLGADRVTIVYRRTRSLMPAYAHEVDEAEAEGVRFEWLTEPVRFLGTQRVAAVECRSMRLGEPDASGRRRPEPVPASEFVIDADTVVKAVGQRRRPEYAKLLEGVDPATGSTSDPRIFAGGDMVNGGQSAVEAVREGKLAAAAIHEFLDAR
jgi:dihydropyrimidine dehydrogenase (NAD+) subunit PreT